MQSPLTVISLAVAILAVGVAGYAVMENRSLRAELESSNLIGPEADGGGGPLIAVATGGAWVSLSRHFFRSHLAFQSRTRAFRSPSIQRSTRINRSVQTVCGQV